MSATAVDFETLIYTQIWNLLNADSVWANLVDPKNQIRYDQESGMQIAEPRNTADSEFPQAQLWIKGGGSDMYTGTETFDTYSDGGPHQPWLETHELTYRLVLKSQFQPLSEPDVLGSQSRSALRAGGPRLGLDCVSKWRTRWSTRQVRGSDNDATRRWWTTIDISVQLQVQSPDLQTT